MAELDISLPYALLLIGTGFAAGIINTLAGGGTNLTLPALMIMGMPADFANATNRLAVFLQSGVGLLGFRGHGRLPTHDIGPILLPTLVGGMFGAAAAVYAPAGLLKPLLLAAMLGMTIIMLARPEVIAPPPGTKPHRVGDRPTSWFWLGLAGFYGGFVQAGVGFILITALAGTLRYDLVRTNALKMACVCAFTTLALGVFIAQGLVLWLPGLILSAGTMAGASTAVRFAIAAKPATLKWFLFAMTLCGTIAALLSG